MPLFQVNTDKCRRCGVCSNVCPAQIIGNDDESLPFLLDGGAERCIGCGQCVAFCPHGASSLEGLPMERVRKVNRKLLPAPESVAELLRTRRSVRIFADKDVPRESLEQIVSMASFAPTAKNQRKVRWIIINDYEKIHTMINYVADWMGAVAGANPTTPLQRAFKVLAAMVRKGKDPIFRGARQVAVAVVQKDVWGRSDAAIALSYFELAAHSMGVGCCWAGYFTTAAEHVEGIGELLGLQEGEVVGGAQMIGYPAIKASYVPPRYDTPIEWL